MTKRIKLANSDKYTILDDDDYEEFKEYPWRESQYGYAIVCKAFNKRSHTFMLHREIAKPPKTMSVDHINGDTLDNRKSNLRVVTHGENMRNQKMRINNSSGYKGVSWHTVRDKWRARVHFEGKEYHVGLFEDKHEAARAYNKKARELFGEYARLNEIKEEQV